MIRALSLVNFKLSKVKVVDVPSCAKCSIKHKIAQIIQYIARGLISYISGGIRIFLCPPCASGRSPRLIACLPITDRWHRTGLVWLNITNCRPGQARPGQGILDYPSEREDVAVILYLDEYIYCSKLNQRPLSNLRSDPKDVWLGTAVQIQRENWWCSPDIQSWERSVKTQDGVTMSLGVSLAPKLTHSNLDHSPPAKLMDTILFQVTSRQFHPTLKHLNFSNLQFSFLLNWESERLVIMLLSLRRIVCPESGQAPRCELCQEFGWIPIFANDSEPQDSGGGPGGRWSPGGRPALIVRTWQPGGQRE